MASHRCHTTVFLPKTFRSKVFNRRVIPIIRHEDQRRLVNARDLPLLTNDEVQIQHYRNVDHIVLFFVMGCFRSIEPLQ